MTRVFAAAACFFAIAGTACAATPDPIAQQESRAAEIARVEAAARDEAARIAAGAASAPATDGGERNEPAAEAGGGFSLFGEA